ncbi:MAG: N-acetylmuramoyl-L-alanine amidase [Micrococcales bacterium]|nr:N-acetylmuramoyl-L-alanine amidase [Micrococcales bacterium]
MVTIATRASWGARHADGDLALSALASEVFVHHTVTTHLSPSASVADEQAQMRAIEAVGQSRFGTGISYNAVIFPSGRAYQGVSWNRRGTHTANRNSTSRSICFAGNLDTHQPTAAALSTAAAIYADGRGTWWAAGAPLRGHRDVAATACPGRYLYARLADIRSGAGTSSGQPAPPSSGQAPSRTIAQMASEVIAGEHGNGHAQRRRSLGVDAVTYERVRTEVNRRLSASASSSSTAPARTVAQMATEVIAGRHGNGHDQRRRSLGVSAAVYAQVRAEVNRRLR